MEVTGFSGGERNIGQVYLYWEDWDSIINEGALSIPRERSSRSKRGRG